MCDLFPGKYNLNFCDATRSGKRTNVVSFFNKNKDKFPGFLKIHDDENGVGYHCYATEKT